MNYRTSIILMASTQDNGDTIRYICPRCDAGSDGEKSLSVTRDESGHLVWQCFKDKCIEKGGTDGSVVSADRMAVRVEKVRKEFKGTTKALSDYHLAQIKSMWGIEDPPYWYYTPEYGGRVAMSIRGPKYQHRGWVLRDIRGNAQVKALNYLEKGEESLSWYKNKRPDVGTILVEDIPSAVRASSHLTAVALLGTAVGLDKAIELEAYAPRPIIIALDQDATAKSFKIASRYGLSWGDTKILTLPKDLKDMTEDELCTTLKKVI